MKDDYGPGLKTSINNRSAVWANVAVNDEDIQGRQAVWSIHTQRSGSTGARGDGGVLPTAGAQGYNEVRDNLAALYHTIKVTGPSIHLSQNDSGSFTRALESELKGGEKDFGNDCARQAFNQAIDIGGTLYLGALTGTATTLVSTTSFTFGNAAQSTLRYFFKGMPVDIVSAAGVVLSSTTVVSVDETTKIVVVAANTAGGATGDYLARQGNFAAASTWGYEMNGLPYLLSPSLTYANLSVSTAPSWAGNAIGSSTTGISDTIFKRANTKVNTNGDGGDINLWIAEPDQEDKLGQVNLAQRRTDGKTVTLPSGWKGIELQRGTLVTDKYCPTTQVFGINTEEIARFVGLDFTWDDTGKTSVIYKALDGSDAVEARFKAYQNLEATNRNSHVIITLQAPSF